MAKEEKKGLLRLRRRQLDNLFSTLSSLSPVKKPKSGWLKEIRKSIGMSGSQFAKKLKISQAAVAKLESSEAKETVSLATLRKAAEALNCRLVYALIPNEALEKIVEKKARAAAEKIVNNISNSMSLEKQAISKKERQKQIEEITEELIRNSNSKLWE